MNQSGWTLGAVVGVVAAMSGAQVAMATVTPGTLFGDSYIVKDGEGASARYYAVMDVYIKCSNSADIIGSVSCVAAFPRSIKTQPDKCFQHSNRGATNCWLPTNDDGVVWDSFVTNGCRVQGSSGTLAGGFGGFLDLQLSVTPNGQPIDCCKVPEGGWYPAIGASTSTNPYAKAGHYGGTGAVNTAKATTTIAGNGIIAGQSLTNYWMVGRFTIDVTGDYATDNTLSMQFCINGKNNGTTTIIGATQTAGQFNYTLTYAAPAPPPCPGDLDNNRVVDTADISVLLMEFGPCTGCPADLDGNGLVDTADISLLVTDFGTCPS
jgi:hypothetical protein